ncbi:pfs domain-containing protein, partial [Colletotrichum orchidophilum]
ISRAGHLAEQKSVKLSTYAVLFLGTPHQGGQGVELAQLFTKVLSVFSHTNNKLLQRMKPNSDWLFDLQERYNAISQDFKTVFYYETLKMPVPLLGSLLVVPKFSAVIFGAADTVAIPLIADHATMVKFTGLDDENFSKVAQMIEFYSKQAPAAVLGKWEHGEHRSRNGIQCEVNPDNEQVPKEFDIGITFKNVWNRHFTGRDQTLHLMDEFLRPGSCQQELNVVVTYGPGGVGKTQLALEYARRQQHHFGSIFWIDGRHPDTVKTSISDCVNRILAHYKVHGITHNPRFDFLKRERELGGVIEAFFTWLAYGKNNSWLLIIDNLDDLEIISLRDILPSTAWGSVLITSRRSDLAITWQSIQVPMMNHDEALALLMRSSNLEPDAGTESM